MSQQIAAPLETYAWNAEDRQELLRFARATWQSFESMTGGNGLPADRLKRSEKGIWKPSTQTSPTDIASYLWAVLSARSLDLIDETEADRRLKATLATLNQLERYSGFFYNLYQVDTGATQRTGEANDDASRPFLSSVDNAWLAAALMMVGNARPALSEQVNSLVGPMDFRFFYVPFDTTDSLTHPGQFHGGYYPDSHKFTTCYGMLNTEPRIISYVAIARRQVPPEQYFRLFRTLPTTHGRQRQTPQGELRSYLGVAVFEGHYVYLGLRIVPSWGGSMFEALMVPLFVPEERWAPRSWGVNHPLYARAQIEEGIHVKKYGYWGFSPSSTPSGGYQTYGVNDIGTDVDGYTTYEIPSGSSPKGSRPVGPARDGVVTPHASFLALRFAPRESLANLRALMKAFAIFDEQGFHDSVDIASGEVSPCVLSLDQGMIIVAIANALADDAIRRAFCEGAIESTIRPLIAVEEFTAGESHRP